MVARALAGKASESSGAFSGNVIRSGGVVIGPGPGGGGGPQPRVFGARAATVLSAKARLTRRRGFTAKAAIVTGATATPSTAGGQVDLVIDALSASPGSPTTAGTPVTFTMTVRNQSPINFPAGVNHSPNIGVGIYLDGAAPPASPIAFTNYDGGLGPGATVNLSTATGWAPSGAWAATEGTHTVTAIVNDQRTFVEGSYTNNSRSISFVVNPGTTPPPSSAQFFTAGSTWNTTVPGAATFTDVPAIHGTGWIESHTYGVPVVIASPSDPLCTVTFAAGSWGWPEGSATVHCPSAITGASGTDGALCIVEPTAQNGYPANEVYDFWQFVRTGPNSGTAQAYAHTNSVTGTGWSLDGVHGAGIHAAGSSLLAGLIRGDDLRSGLIQHALAIACRFDLVQPWPNFVPPAISADGSGGPIKEGQRYAIPPGVAMPTGMNIQGQTLWNTCQQYGCFVIDVNGGNAAIQFWADGLSVPDTDMNALYHPPNYVTTELNNIAAALKLVG